MVDAPDSGSGGRKAVLVRVQSRAPSTSTAKCRSTSASTAPPAPPTGNPHAAGAWTGLDWVDHGLRNRAPPCHAAASLCEEVRTPRPASVLRRSEASASSAGNATTHRAQRGERVRAWIARVDLPPFGTGSLRGGLRLRLWLWSECAQAHSAGDEAPSLCRHRSTPGNDRVVSTESATKSAGI